MLAAHAIPPSAFQNRNVGHGILFIPASHAEAIRRPETQRPRNTAFGPWRAKNGSPCSSTASRCVWNGPGRANSRRPPLRPIANPTLSPTIAAADADHHQRDDVQLAVVGEQRRADQRGLAGDGDAHRLDRDQREHDGVPDVRGKVDDRREHVREPAVARRRRRATHVAHTLPRHGRSGSSRVRAPTRCRASRAAARSRSRRPWGDALVSRGTFAGTEVLHVSRHEAGHARLSNLVTHRANIAALAQLGAQGVIGVTVCGAVDPSVELGSIVCFDDLHFLANRLGDGELCTFYPEPGDRRRGHWIFEDPFSAELRRALLDGRGRGRRARSATAAATATSTARASTPRPRSAGSPPAGVDRRLADRRAGDGAVRRGGAALRAARVRDRLRERGPGRADAGADAARHDGREHRDVRGRARRRGAARGGRRAGAGGHRSTASRRS